MSRAASIAVAALAAAAAWSPAAAAQPTRHEADRLPASAADPTLASLEQKRVMVERILRDSPVATRVAASDNAEAKRHLATARQLYVEAQALLAEGRTATADALLNEAMWQVGRGRQLVPDPIAVAIEERARYQKLTESIAALRASYRINVERERARGASEPTAGREDAAANRLVDEATALAAAERHGEANRLLDRALALLLKDFHAQLGGQALIYSRSFPQPQDEYAFELERNRSYESLVPLAITEFRPGPDALALANRYVGEGAALRERAARQATARNLKAAVRSLQDSTDALQRALQATGLSVPQTIGQQ